ncbi:hypothetical protein CSW98_06750 [Vibrio sp. HA2012]|uniref:DUF4405 domain-containing protein n=1 Tax=Vibrio sp. HA2012 TaxID=1971595 RepID=UPI000C2CDE62|nr:DUF4405 domain-containing protein [Vibrio sp. HA2012]PJC86687.1 hypothetical protein CSW98_06750 [Vibrio sp. HA2012]
MFKPMEKSWLSPFLLITYISTSVTGIFMLFHIKFPGLYPVHEWGGLLFVAAGIFHVIINWKMLVSYFNKDKLKRNAIVGTVIGLCLIAIIAVAIPSNKHSGRGVHASAESALQINIPTENT